MQDTNRSASEPSLLQLLHRANQLANSVFARELEQDHLTPRQYFVLSVLEAEPGLSQIGVVLRTGIDRSTMTEILRRLSRRGFIVRERSLRDARAFVLTVTTLGHRTLSDTKDKAVRADGRLRSALPPDAGNGLRETLKSLINTLDAKNRI
jgi:DNA-binding MarR family transcriptional regulator